jgi:hypothetical protein
VLITENPRLSDVLLYEAGVEVNYTVDTVTVASGTLASPIGQVLSKVTASGKYVQVAPVAVDGSAVAAGILLEPITATLTADTQLNVLTRGPAVVKSTGLAYTTAMTSTQITAALAQLLALGIKTELAFGV